jgi:uncharacterized protein DUF2490
VEPAAVLYSKDGRTKPFALGRYSGHDIKRILAILAGIPGGEIFFLGREYCSGQGLALPHGHDCVTIRTAQNRDRACARHSSALRASVVLLCFCLWTLPAMAQEPNDPENDKRLGLWIDQPISANLAPDKSLELEFHQRFDNGASNFYEYFFQGGIAFRLRPWLTLLPSYRYQRFPGDPTIAFENRILLNTTLATELGKWRPILRLLAEGRFPDSLVPSARLRFRPGIEYTLPLRIARPPVIGASDELFFVPGTNSFAAGGAYTQNRFQVGIRLAIADCMSIRPYFLLQSVNRAAGWATDGIIGLSFGFKF